MKKRVLVLGNRLLGAMCMDFFQRQPNVEMMVVLNPDDDGQDSPGGVSLKRRCIAAGIAHIQPDGLRDEAVQATLRDFAPDLALSCSYARIIPQLVIDLPTSFFLNVHYADLPRNRGCLPVIWTLASGAECYSATLHRVTAELDQGAVLSQAHEPITPGQTAGDLYAACSQLGYRLVRDFWQKWIQTGSHASRPQDEADVTYHKMRFPHDRWIQWKRDAADVARLINALTYYPHPAARTLGPDGAELGLVGPCLVVDRPPLHITDSPGVVRSSELGPVILCNDKAVLPQACRVGDAIVPVSEVLTDNLILSSPNVPEYKP